MSGMFYDPELSDVVNDGYASGQLSVTSTAVEAKVGANRLTGREILTITNLGPQRIYYGPLGVTPTSGDVLEKGQFISMPAGSSVAVYVVCASSHTATVAVQEYA